MSQGMGLRTQGKLNNLFFYTGKNKSVNKSESSANYTLDLDLGIEDMVTIDEDRQNPSVHNSLWEQRCFCVCIY